MNRNDVLAYLNVLGHPLHAAQLYVANAHMMGCLHRIVQQLEEEGHEELALAVRERERINGRVPYGHPDLVAATRKCIDLFLEREVAEEARLLALIELQHKIVAGQVPPPSIREIESHFDWLNQGEENV